MRWKDDRAVPVEDSRTYVHRFIPLIEMKDKVLGYLSHLTFVGYGISSILMPISLYDLSKRDAIGVVTKVLTAISVFAISYYIDRTYGQPTISSEAETQEILLLPLRKCDFETPRLLELAILERVGGGSAEAAAKKVHLN